MKKTHQDHFPRVIEIVGPAGAGKTTLYDELAQYSDCLRLQKFPYASKLENRPFYFWYGLLLAIKLLQLPRRNSRFLSRREFAWLTVLTGWNNLLGKELEQDKRALIIDQGPIYLIAELQKTGPEYLQRPESAWLWNKIYSIWANTIDIIFWLDAEDRILVERIRSREKDHLVKEATEEEMIGFLRNFRTSYETIFDRLSTNISSPKIIRLDSGEYSPHELAQRVINELAQKMMFEIDIKDKG